MPWSGSVLTIVVLQLIQTFEQETIKVLEVLTGETRFFLLTHAENYRSAHVLACSRFISVTRSHGRGQA